MVSSRLIWYRGRMTTSEGLQGIERVTSLFERADLDASDRTKADAFLAGLVASYQGGILKEASLNDIVEALDDSEPATLEERIRLLIDTEHQDSV